MMRRWGSAWTLTPFRIAAVYTVFGAASILAIGALLITRVSQDPSSVLSAPLLVGWLFILITAVLLYFLVRWGLAGLGESERVLITLMKNLPGMAYRCLNEPDWTMLFVSDGCRSLTGYTPEELLKNQKVSYGHLILPPDRERVWQEVQDAVQAGRPFEITDRIRTADGDEKWVWGRGVAVRMPDREEVVLEGIVADITERRRAEQVNALLATAVEQAGEGMLITDRDGTILYANPAFETITGYSRQEVVGLTPRLLKSGEHDEGFYREMWETLGRGEIWSSRIINKKKDGSLYEERQTISPVRDASGHTVNYVAVKRDVTEVVSLESQLRQAQKLEAVGKLAGGIAHDFNNLLMAIMGHTELLIHQSEDGSAVRSDLEEIKKASLRAAALTRQLLAFSRRQILQPRYVNLNFTVREMIALLERLIGVDVELTTRLDPKLELVRADPSQIEQVIMNLSVNARDAMADGGKLSIETSNVVLDEEYAAGHMHVEPGPYVMLTVSDTGSGIKKSIQSRVFEPFFSTKAEKGTGLGLSTVYGIVKQSGGNIWLDSEPGHGTTFKIYLPQVRSKGEGRDEDDSAADIPGPATPASETILLIEAEGPVRGTLDERLERAGYLVLAAKSPEHAVALCREYPERISLLITDTHLPGLTGRELVARLSALRPSTRVLYISSHSEDASLEAGLIEGGDAYLQKPFSDKRLLRKVRLLIGPPEEITSNSGLAIEAAD